MVFHGHHVYPITNSDASLCNIDAHFCRFFPYSSSARSSVDCIQALLTAGGVSKDVLHTACPFKCVDSNPASISVVSLGFQDNSYSYAVFIPSTTTWIECQNSSEHLTRHSLSNNSITQGSYLIHLKCGCTLKFAQNLHDDVRPPFPCYHDVHSTPTPTVPKVSIIIPSRWSYLPGDQILRAIRLDQALLASEGHQNFSSAFNPSWFKSDLVLDVGKAYQFSEKGSFISHLASHANLYSGGFSLFGDIFLACIIFYLLYKLTLLNRKFHVAAGVAYTQVSPARALTDTELTHHITIWLSTILVFNLLFLGVLVVCCIACRKKLRIECVDISPDQPDPESYLPSSRSKINQSYRLPSYPEISYHHPHLQSNRTIGSVPAVTFHPGHSTDVEPNRLYPEQSFLTRLRND